VPTVTFNVLFVFVILVHDRRRVVHFNVTGSPGAKWTAQQIVEAFPWDSAPRSPWQSPYVERLIGTLRRDCIDHVIVLNERHLRRLLRGYLTCYQGSRTHLSLEKDSPEPRKVEPPDRGKIVEIPMIGGLHHRYRRSSEAYRTEESTRRSASGVPDGIDGRDSRSIPGAA